MCLVRKDYYNEFLSNQFFIQLGKVIFFKSALRTFVGPWSNCNELQDPLKITYLK